MQNLIVLAVLAVVVMAVLSPLLEKSGAGEGRVRRKSLMTQNELDFWRLLRAAAAPLHVGPQVAMGALLDTRGGGSAAVRRATRNRFDRKIVDFILFDDRGRVQLLVELDDSTHDGTRQVERDRVRDKRTAEAGYPTLRLKRRDARTVPELAARIAAMCPSERYDRTATSFR